MAFVAAKVNLIPLIREALEKIAKSRKGELRMVKRAQIALHAADGLSNQQIAEIVGLSSDTCSEWRGRIIDALPLLEEVAGEALKEMPEWPVKNQSVVCIRPKPQTPEEQLAVDIWEATVALRKDARRIFKQSVIQMLSDKPRSGRPPIFQPEEVAGIMKMACQKPQRYGYEQSAWSSAALADAAVKEGIVESVSPKTIWRKLQAAKIRPWRSRYWLNSAEKINDPEGYRRKVEEICWAYINAQRLLSQGVRIVCMDEMTGVQALSRIAPDKNALPESDAKLEFEYKRNGTIAMIAGREVAAGIVFDPYIGERRTEEDFVKALEQIVATDPNADWWFIMDNLNTHMSESLVRKIAELCGIEIDLGIKGREGILKSMATRAEFLHDPEHSIRIIYTPQHSSWLNQVEIWFSVLSRKLLKKGNFNSITKLEKSIRKFVELHNVTAKAYNWTYTGQVLAA